MAKNGKTWKISLNSHDFVFSYIPSNIFRHAIKCLTNFQPAVNICNMIMNKPSRLFLFHVFNFNRKVFKVLYSVLLTLFINEGA